MIALNHALSGALIGLAVGEPWLAIPAALASHFICDAIPHFGRNTDNDTYIRSKGFARYLLLDSSLCIGLVAVLAISQPNHWLLAAVCAFIATSPDFLWFTRFTRARRGGSSAPGKFWLLQFASKIQWFQRPIGSVVEVAWFVGCATLLRVFL